MKSNRKRSPKPKSTGKLRRFGFGLAFVGLAFTLGFAQLRNSLPNQIRSKIQSTLNSELGRFGLVADLRQAEFIDGKGFRITDLRIRDLNSEDPSSSIIEIHDAMIVAPISFADLALSKVRKIPVQSVEVSGGKFTAIRNPQGEWELAPLLQHLKTQSGEQPDDIIVRLSDCTARIVDQFNSVERVQTIRDINLTAGPVIHQDRKLVQVTGHCSGLAVSKINIKAFVDPAKHSWFTEIEAIDAQLTTELFKLLPRETATAFEDVQVLGGKLNLKGTAHGKLVGRQLPSFKVRGQLANFSLSDRRLPVNLKDCSVDFSLTPNSIIVSRAVGQANQGSFAVSYRQQGLFDRQSWSAAGQLLNFNFNPKIHPWLPNSCKTFCDDFQPRGYSNIDFRIGFDGQKYSRDIRSDITNMSFNFNKFPYPFERCNGKVTWIQDECRFELKSKIGPQPVRAVGRVIRPGKNSTYAIDIEANGDNLLDPKLIAALTPYPDLKRQVLAFRPNGFVSGSGTIFKTAPDQVRPNRSFDVRIKNATVNHQAFPYPIGNVNGVVKVRNDVCNFIEFNGGNGNAEVRCDGIWDKSVGLDLRFLCRNVPFDDHLRNSIKPNLKEIWDDFRPRGTIGLSRVELKIPAATKIASVVVESDLALDTVPQNGVPRSTVAINPKWFPYEISQVTGKVRIGEGQIRLTDCRGKHRRTWMVCQGEGIYTPEAWSVSLKNLLVGSLSVDDDLLYALPVSLADPIRHLEFEGQLNVKGEITVGGRQATTQLANSNPSNIGLASYNAVEPEPSSTKMFWDLRLDMDQASMYLGQPVKNIFGMVQLAGEYDGQNASCAGEIAIDSLMFHGAQVTNLRGPIWIDPTGVSAGTLANRANPQAEPRQIVGELFQGQLRLDARKQSDEDGRFFVQSSLYAGNLAEAVDDFAPSATDISGKCYGTLRLTGDESGTHSYRGRGTVNLRDAKIYELPVVLSLLKILRIKEVNRTAFDTSSVDYEINGSNIELNRIELIGDAISLIGNGVINFSQKLDLNFYSVVGRNRFYIPLLSEIYRAGSQRILWITVDGTLSNPNTHRNILPQLNDTIRKLLQPAERPSPALLPNNAFPAARPIPNPQYNQAAPVNSSAFQR